MMDIQDFYILGLPVDTELGKVDFVRVRDYPDYFGDLQIISISKSELIYRYKEINKDGSLDKLIEEMERLSLFELSIGLPELRQAYSNIYIKTFHEEDAIELIDDDNFEYYRSLIMKMNVLREEKINPNPEIQRAIERSKRVKSQGQEKLTFSDICSSIVAHSSIDYSEINDWTIYQLYMTFHRIGAFKSYDTNALFATVTTEAKVENWSKHIDLFEEEKHFIEEDKFKETTGSMFE